MHSNRGLYCLRFIHRVNIIAWPNLTCYLLHGLIARPNLRNYIHQIASTCNYIHQVSPVMGWGELGVAHPGALRPQKLPVEPNIMFQHIGELGSHLICVHVCCQKMAIARAGPDPAKEVNWYGYVFVFYYFTLVLPPTLWILGCTPPHIVGTGRSLPPSHHIQNLLPVVGKSCVNLNIDHVWPWYSWCQTHIVTQYKD